MHSSKHNGDNRLFSEKRRGEQVFVCNHPLGDVAWVLVGSLGSRIALRWRPRDGELKTCSDFDSTEKLGNSKVRILHEKVFRRAS